MADVAREIRVRLVVREVRLAHKDGQARLHAVGGHVADERVGDAVILRVGERVGAGRLRDRRLAAAERGARAQRIRVETSADRDAAGDIAAAVAKRDRRAVFRVAGQRPDGCVDGRASDGDLRHVALLEAELARGRGRHEERVVPGDLGRGVGKLLQPAEVREVAAGDLAVDLEADFELAAETGSGLAAEVGERARVHRTRDRLPRGAFDGAAVEIAPPP